MGKAMGFNFIIKVSTELLEQGKPIEAANQINNLLFILSKATDEGVIQLDNEFVDYWKTKCWDFLETNKLLY